MAQENNNSHYSNWNTLIVNASLKPKIYVRSEFNFRRTNFLSDWEQIVLRPSIHYGLNDHLEAALGYSYIENFSYSTFSRPIDASEHNLWQQFGIEHNFPRFSMVHRLRLEERFIDNVTQGQEGEFEMGEIKKNNRFRYRFQINFPIKTFKNGKELGLVGYNEGFLSLDTGLWPKTFDQNWTFFDISFNPNKKWNIRSGYHDIIAKTGTDSHIKNHIWETTLTFKII